MLADSQGRLCSNGATDCASLFTKQGKKGINQDAMIVWENFGSREGTTFCGVFDGHGPYGHMVARKVRSSLPLRLSALWDGNTVAENQRSMGLGKGAYECNEPNASETNGSHTLDLNEAEQHSKIYLALKKSLLEAYDVMDRELKKNSRINCFCSGTTSVTLVKQGAEVVIGNLGDSRAVLGTRGIDNTLVALQLTVDLKPNLPGEEERIKQCKGRIFALKEEPEVARVWLPNTDSPGLAMARAFGDLCLKKFGLISVPEISYRHLRESDEFIVLATDGVWDVLSNQEVVNIIASAPTRPSSARFLVESAIHAWKDKYPTSKIDDVAVVCLYLSAESSSSSSSIESDHDNEDSRDTSELSSEPLLIDAKALRPGLRKRTVGNTDRATDEVDWSALEGVSRANTLLKLP